MPSYPVKHLRSQMRGAPVLSGAIGALIPVLDACLLTGFGQVTLTSLVVAGGVATATVNSGEWFEVGAIILIAGATPAGLNGEQQVLSQSSTTFTFATDAPNGTATGTITAKYAPVGGWQKVYSGTNKAVYKSIDPDANGHFLRVDDTTTISARVSGFEAMTDVDTGTGGFPTDAQISGGGYWIKSANSASNAVSWRVVGDCRIFEHAIDTGLAVGQIIAAFPYCFGDPVGGDPWATVLCASNSNAQSNGSLQAANSSTAYGCFTPRPSAGIGSSLPSPHRPLTGGSLHSGADTAFGEAPVPDGPSVVLAPVILQTTSGRPRATIPGILHVAHTGIRALFAAGDVLGGAGALSGRRLVFVPASASNNYGTPIAGYFIDTSGPWR